jgi:hypothetical protein
MGILSRRLGSWGSIVATLLSTIVSSRAGAVSVEEASSISGDTAGGDRFSDDNFIRSRSLLGGRKDGDPGAFDIVFQEISRYEGKSVGLYMESHVV